MLTLGGKHRLRVRSILAVVCFSCPQNAAHIRSYWMYGLSATAPRMLVVEQSMPCVSAGHQPIIIVFSISIIIIFLQ